MLIGGGEFSFGETREIDEFLLSILPTANQTIAFLPTASGSNEYAPHLRNYFRTIAPEVELVNVPIYRNRDARRGKNLELIRNAGLIYIGGGSVTKFLSVIRNSAAEEAMREAASSGSAIAGIAAGAAVLGRAGMNWIVNCAIATGFRPENEAELRRLMTDPEVKLGIGIPARCALAIGGDGSGQILGEGSVAIVRRAGAAVQ